MAKSLLCTIVVILELFPTSSELLHQFIPIEKIIELLKLTPRVKESDYDESDYFNDIIDLCCYISKSEDYVMVLASNDQIFSCIKDQLALIQKDRHLLLHGIIAMAGALIDDKTTRNAEIANDKWGADMEGFKLLEQLREKVSAQTPTLISKYTKEEIEKSGVKMRLLKDLGVANLLSEYFNNLKSTKMAEKSEENIVNFLLMISEEK